MKLKDIMSQNVETVTPDVTLKECAETSMATPNPAICGHLESGRFRGCRREQNESS
jgi:hypothetical protein